MSTVREKVDYIHEKIKNFTRSFGLECVIHSSYKKNELSIRVWNSLREKEYHVFLDDSKEESVAVLKYEIVIDFDLHKKFLAVFDNETSAFTKRHITKRYIPEIMNVIFNEPATIIFWSDGTKTVVKAQDEYYDPEKGMAMAIAKKALGNQGNYCNIFKKWLPEEDDSIEIPFEFDGEAFNNALKPIRELGRYFDLNELSMRLEPKKEEESEDKE